LLQHSSIPFKSICVRLKLLLLSTHLFSSFVPQFAGDLAQYLKAALSMRTKVDKEEDQQEEVG